MHANPAPAVGYCQVKLRLIAAKYIY